MSKSGKICVSVVIGVLTVCCIGMFVRLMTLSSSTSSPVVASDYVTVSTASKYQRDDYLTYYTAGSDTDSMSVYYDKGVWVMYYNDVLSKVQQYLVSPLNTSVYDIVKNIPSFDEESATYYGYSTDGNIVEADKTKTFKEIGSDYLFVEWAKDGYYYGYTFQKQDVGIYAIYADQSNLFRVYAAEILQQYAEAEQSTTDTGVSTDDVTNTETEVATETVTDVVTEVETDNSVVDTGVSE